MTLTVRSGDVCGIAVSQRTGQTNKQTNDIVEKQERGLNSFHYAKNTQEKKTRTHNNLQ